jgi:hypothetical protein
LTWAKEGSKLLTMDKRDEVPIEMYDVYIAEVEKIQEEYFEALEVAKDELRKRLAEEQEREDG